MIFRYVIVLSCICIGYMDNPSPAATTQPVRSPQRQLVAVFDFTCQADQQTGRDLSRRVRGLLSRSTADIEVIDHLSMNELTDALDVRLDTPDQLMAAWLADRIGATAAVWGELATSGAEHTLTVRYVDLTGIAWRKVFTDATERAGGQIARGVAQAITGRAAWTPPQYGDETEPKQFDKPLNRNGSFDAKGFDPVGWDPVDGVSSLVVPRAGRGRVLRLNTHLDRDAWLTLQHTRRRGEGDPRNPPKIGPSPQRYRNVGAMEGVMLLSEWLPAAPGRRYWLTADVRGPAKGDLAPKIFIKGYRDFAAKADSLSDVSLRELALTPAAFAALDETRRKELIAADARAHPERHRREVYRWYLACRDETGDPDAWRHCAAPFPPCGGLPADVQYLRIQIYAYWPLGEYLFDNVHLYADPRQTAPAPAVQPQTPGGRGNLKSRREDKQAQE